MKFKSGDKFRHNGHNYLVYSVSYENYYLADLDTGLGVFHKTDGTEEKIIATYTVDNNILLSDVKVGEKFKYYDTIYIKIDPIKVGEANNALYTSKCIDQSSGYIGRGFCIPLDKMVELVKD